MNKKGIDKMNTKKILGIVAVLALVAVAMVGAGAAATDVGTEDALKTAVSSDNFDVKLVNSITLSDSTLSISKSGSIDLNGFTITTKDNANFDTITISGSADVTIKGSGYVQCGVSTNDSGKIALNSSSTGIITIDGVTINGGESVLSSDMGSLTKTAGNALNITGSGSIVNIKNGSIINGGYGSGVTGGMFAVGGAAIKVYNNANACIINSTVTGGESKLYNAGDGIEFNSNGKLTVDNSMVTGGKSNGCTVGSSTYGIGGSGVVAGWNNTPSIEIMNDSKVIGGQGGESWIGYGIELSSVGNATITVSDSSIIGGPAFSDAKNTYGMGMAISTGNGNITFENATLSAESNDQFRDSKTYGLVSITSGSSITNLNVKKSLTIASDSKRQLKNAKIIVTSDFSGETVLKTPVLIAEADNVTFDVKKDGYLVSTPSELTGYYYEYKLVQAAVKNTTQNKCYLTLTEAFDDATDGDTIQLLTDIGTAENMWEFATCGASVASGKTITLDLNGKSVYGKSTATGYTQMIEVHKNAKLIVDDITTDKNGGLYYIDSQDDVGGATIRAHGDVDIKAGTIENTTKAENSAIQGALDVSPNEGNQAVTVNVTGGRLISNGDNTVRITKFSANVPITFNMSGGYIYGNDALFIQGVKDNYIGPLYINLTGGEFNGRQAIRVFCVMSKAASDPSDIRVSLNITGGTFNNDVGSNSTRVFYKGIAVQNTGGTDEAAESYLDVKISGGIFTGKQAGTGASGIDENPKDGCVQGSFCSETGPDASGKYTWTVSQNAATVSYNANEGIGNIASQTVSPNTIITLNDGSTLTRDGYTVYKEGTGEDAKVVWYSDASGTTKVGLGGDSYTVTGNITLYPKWTANTYTINFDGNDATSGSTASMSGLSYGEAYKLNPNNFEKTGYTFAGWSSIPTGTAEYSDKETVKDIPTLAGEVTLYAVWTQNVYSVGGNYSGENGTVEIKLQKGNAEYATASIDTTNKTFTFTNVPAGTYNLVATDSKDTTVKTVTQAVIVTNANLTGLSVKFPAKNVTSKVEVVPTNDTPAVVVANVDTEASTIAGNDNDAKVIATVVTEVKSEVPETDTKKVEVQEGISGIENIAGGSEGTLNYLNLTVKESIDNGTEYEVAETSCVLGFSIPYNTVTTKIIGAYRYHDGVAETLTPLSGKQDETNPSTWVEGYYVAADEGNLYIYAKKFSIYGYSSILNTDTDTSKSSTVTMNVDFEYSFDIPISIELIPEVDKIKYGGVTLTANPGTKTKVVLRVNQLANDTSAHTFDLTSSTSDEKAKYALNVSKKNGDSYVELKTVLTGTENPGSATDTYSAENNIVLRLAETGLESGETYYLGFVTKKVPTTSGTYTGNLTFEVKAEEITA